MKKRCLKNDQPDLLAQFDDVRYQLPDVPESMAGRAFSDANAVSANLSERADTRATTQVQHLSGDIA